MKTLECFGKYDQKEAESRNCLDCYCGEDNCKQMTETGKVDLRKFIVKIEMALEVMNEIEAKEDAAEFLGFHGGSILERFGRVTVFEQKDVLDWQDCTRTGE